MIHTALRYIREFFSIEHIYCTFPNCFTFLELKSCSVLLDCFKYKYAKMSLSDIFLFLFTLINWHQNYFEIVQNIARVKKNFQNFDYLTLFKF